MEKIEKKKKYWVLVTALTEFMVRAPTWSIVLWFPLFIYSLDACQIHLDSLIWVSLSYIPILIAYTWILENDGYLSTNVLLHFFQVLRTALSNRLAKVQGFLFRAAFLRRVPLFFRLISENILLCFLLSVIHSTSKYVTGTLSLCFRKILTKHIHANYFEVITVTFFSFYVCGK